jgi:type II secretory pathway component PulF
MTVSFFDNLTYKLASAEDKLNLMEDIAFLLDQDMPLTDIAIDLKKGSSFEKIIGQNLEASIQNSRPLYEVFAPLLTKPTLQALKAGTDNGDASKGFKDAREAMLLAEGLFGQLISSYIVPTIKMLGVMLGSSFLGDYIFQQLVVVSPPARWSFFSKGVYDYTQFVVNNFSTIIGFVFALFLTAYFVTTQVTGPIRGFIDKLPFFKQYRTLCAGITLSNLATLMNSDQSLIFSVKFLQKDASNYIKYHLGRVEENITNSKGILGKTLNTGMVNERDIHRLNRSIPENEVGDRLQLSAESHNTILKRQIETLEKVNKFAFLIFFVGSLGVIFASVFLVALSIK